MIRRWATLSLLAVAGCTLPQPNKPTTQATQPSAKTETPAPSPKPAAVVAAPPREPKRMLKAEDPPLLIRPLVNLSIVQRSVPLGAVSRSDEFWKRVQEHAVDVASHDLLQKNGIRVGTIPLAELGAVLDTLDTLGRERVELRPATFVAAGAKLIELPMKRGIPTEVLYDFDAQNTMTLRTYEDCENVFVVEFQPAPRKAGDVLLKLVPMVRGLRTRLVPISDHETREIEFRNPERYFELSLKAHLPVDSVLVIAPSLEGHDPMSIGHAFLVHETEVDRIEEVLLIVPQPVAPRAAKPSETASQTPAGPIHAN